MTDQYFIMAGGHLIPVVLTDSTPTFAKPGVDRPGRLLPFRLGRPLRGSPHNALETNR